MIYNIISLVKIKPIKRHNVHFLQNQHRSINKNAHDCNFNISIIHCTCVTKKNKTRKGNALYALNTA